MLSRCKKNRCKKLLAVVSLIISTNVTYASEHQLDQEVLCGKKKYSNETNKEENKQENLKKRKVNVQNPVFSSLPQQIDNTNVPSQEQKIWVMQQFQWPKEDGVVTLTNDPEKQKKIKSILAEQFPENQNMFDVSSDDCSRLKEFFAPYTGDLLPEEKRKECTKLWEKANAIQNNQESFSLLREIALLGHPNIQYHLVPSLEGKEEGINFLHRAAAQGHAAALEKLSNFYSTKDKDSTQFRELADLLLKVAVLKNNSDAQLKFAHKYSFINLPEPINIGDFNNKKYLAFMRIFSKVGNNRAKSLIKYILHPGDIVDY